MKVRTKIANGVEVRLCKVSSKLAVSALPDV